MLPINQPILSRPVITKPNPSHKRFPFIAIVVGIVLTVIPGIITLLLTQPKGSVQGIATSLTPSEIISVTNAARQTAGLSPVHPNPQLMSAAEAKAKAMLAANSWSHNTPTETPWQFIASTGYQYSIAGENLARNYDTAQSVVEAWLDSPSHKDNLLNPNYTDIGVAVETGNFPGKPNSVLVVQYFATRYEAGTQHNNPTDYAFTPLLSGPSGTSIPIVKIVLSITVIAIAFILGIIAKKIHHQRQFEHQQPAVSHWHK